MFSLNKAPQITNFSDYALLITQYLERHVEMPTAFKAVIQCSALRQLDSVMLIEDDLSPFSPLVDIHYSQDIPAVSNLGKMEELIEKIKLNGLPEFFHALIAEFGYINTLLSSSKEQQDDVQRWSEKGYSATFLMTDAGGPSLKEWNTTYNPETGMLTVDKVWGIGAHELDFATIIATQPGSVMPIAFQVPPEACQELVCTKVGLSYLDGQLQLGNCAGEIKVKPEWILRQGGLLAVKQFLSIIRPFFVRGLMAHVTWLASQERLTLSAAQSAAIEYLNTVSQSMTKKWAITRYSEDEVMALKFASNALLFELVETQAVKHVSDQRDLLAFTKMEGSSYRCFLEIYARSGKRKC